MLVNSFSIFSIKFMIAKNLKTLMTRMTLSEHELSRKTGIKQPIIHRLLSGENTNPKLDTVKPIARYFSISISQLIGEEALFNDNIDTHWITTHCKLSNKAFTLQIHDNDLYPAIPKNAIVIVEPVLSPITGNFVLIKNKNKLVVKHYIKKENNIFLFSSINDLHTVEILTPETAIAGIVVSVIYTACKCSINN